MADGAISPSVPPMRSSPPPMPPHPYQQQQQPQQQPQQQQQRFVVTDVPEQCGFPADTDVDLGGQEVALSPQHKRTGKTERRGRFTITDLTPESPQSVRANGSDLRAQAAATVSAPSLGHGAAQVTRMRLTQRSKSLDPRYPGYMPSPNMRLHADNQSQCEEPTAVCHSRDLLPHSPMQHAATLFTNMETSSSISGHADLPNEFPSDASVQLGDLQRECTDMKRFLEEAIAGNAVRLEMFKACNSAHHVPLQSIPVHHESSSVKPAASGFVSVSMTNPPFTDSWESKYQNLNLIHMDLEKRYHKLLRKNQKLKERNALLLSRLHSSGDNRVGKNGRLGHRVDRRSHAVDSSPREIESEFGISSRIPSPGTGSHATDVRSVASTEVCSEMAYRGDWAAYSRNGMDSDRAKEWERGELVAVSDSNSEVSPSKSNVSFSSHCYGMESNDTIVSEAPNLFGTVPDTSRAEVPQMPSHLYPYNSGSFLNADVLDDTFGRVGLQDNITPVLRKDQLRLYQMNNQASHDNWSDAQYCGMDTQSLAENRIRSQASHHQIHHQVSKRNGIAPRFSSDAHPLGLAQPTPTGMTSYSAGLPAPIYSASRLGY